jgi:hypothetical protein
MTTKHPVFAGCKGANCLDGREVVVWVNAGLSHTGDGRDKRMRVDGCIADLVGALYPLAASSCCGHGQTEGRILLYDGRVLRVYHDRSSEGAMPTGEWGYDRSKDLPEYYPSEHPDDYDERVAAWVSDKEQ